MTIQFGREVSQKDCKDCISNAIIGKKSILYSGHKHLFTHDYKIMISNTQDLQVNNKISSPIGIPVGWS